MDASDPVAPYLPTVERARAEGISLPSAEPAEVRRVAGLVVFALVMQRRGWEDKLELSQAAAARIERDEPPAPQGREPQSYLRLAEVLGAASCSMCPGRPGFAICRVCCGTQLVSLGNGPFQVRPCSCGSGLVACPQCEGTGQTVLARVHYLRDYPASMHEIYVPPEMSFAPGLFSFEGAFEKVVHTVTPPECLRCHDLRPRSVSTTAYRGGGRMVLPDFRGHEFAGTIEKAVAALEALSAGGRIVAQTVLAYAWPLLWLRYGVDSPEREVVLFASPEGTLQVFTGRAPEDS
jgi:hypothetical protein